MVRSIRFKLMVYMMVNIFLFTVLLYAANTFFAEKYYLEQKKNAIVRSSSKLKELVRGRADSADYQDENLAYEIVRIERSIGGTVIVGTREGIQYYPSFRNDVSPPRHGISDFIPYNSNGRPLKRSPGAKLPGKGVSVLEQVDKNAFFVRVEDTRLKIDTIRYQVKLENGLLMQIWVPMAGISESAAVSNRFTTIIGLLIALFTGLWSLYISGKFTKPIMQINRVAKKMSGLDFSETLQVTGDDEIAQLSRSISNLSCELDKAIGRLNSKNRQLEEDIYRERKLDKMRQEFVSSVSHELKTPIFLIQGYADGLKSNVADDEVKRDFYCDVIMEEADKLNTLVKDLLDLSQMQSGIFKVDKCGFDISSLAKDVAAKFGPVLEEKNIDMELKDIDNLLVNADPVRIEQVLINYLNNAVNHVDDQRKIRLAISSSEGKARVSVFNSGRHIPEEAHEKIWISFYKLDKARTREYGGMGLGLSIVRAIMEAHQSACGVNNVAGGVEFWFEIDLLREPSDPSCKGN